MVAVDCVQSIWIEISSLRLHAHRRREDFDAIACDSQNEKNAIYFRCEIPPLTISVWCDGKSGATSKKRNVRTRTINFGANKDFDRNEMRALLFRLHVISFIYTEWLIQSLGARASRGDGHTK